MGNKFKQIQPRWYFLIIIVIAYVILFIFNKALFISSLKFFIDILYKIIPVLIVIFFLMVLINYLISPKKILKHLGHDSGIKGWLIAIIGGIFSQGPVYIWYPLLADLKNKGMRIGLISTFIYSRAIKIPLLPFLILYFSVKYMLILTIVLIVMSIFNGLIVEKIILNSASKVFKEEIIFNKQIQK